MGLKIIYGRAGSGKTEYCFQEIQEKIKQGEKVYIVTPEQFSFTAEKNLMEVIETSAVMQAEVLTFARMAYRVFLEVGGRTEICLSDCGTNMLLYDVLDNEKNKLKFLGKSSKNVGIIHRLFTEFKKRQINSQQVKEVIEKIDDRYLKEKLTDILQLQEAYENKIPENYMDSADRLNKLADKIPESTMFNNSIIYLDEFAGFTKQEYGIIERLLKKAKQVNVTICTDELEENSNMETDLFYANKITALRLIELAKSNNIQIQKPVILRKNYRFKVPELAHLEKNIYRTEREIYSEEPHNIELSIAMNPYAEIENVAKKITNLVREENYRFKEIAIIAKNIDTYSAITKAVFSQYDIPVFIDKTRDLSQPIFVQFLLAFLDIFSKNWSSEAVFSYLKTGLIDISREDIFKLENYCLNWGIKGKKWYADDWNFGNLNKEEIEYINNVRKLVVEPLIEFKKKLETNRTVKNISGQIYYFLKENKIFENLEKKEKALEEMGEKELANDYRVSIKVVMEVLDELVNLFGEQQINFEKYRELLKIGLENKELGAIPGVQDEVVMGDVDRSRSHKVRAVFILGINDGVFPSNCKEEGFLDDKDREKLKEENIELAKGTMEQLYDERFNIYKALSVAEERLYLSYTSTDSEGKAIRPSVLLTDLKKIFPKLVEKSNIFENNNSVYLEKSSFNELLEQIHKLKQGEKIEPIWYSVYNYYKNEPQWNNKLEEALKGLNYTNLPEQINERLMNKLYGNTLHTSVSRLEQYRKCPFSFHLKYGLKLKDPIVYTIKPIDTGTFMHEVIEEFFEKVKENKLDLEQIGQEELKQIVIEIIDNKLKISKYYNLTSNAKFRTLTRRLKKIVIKSMEYIVAQLVNSKFKVLSCEMEFKKGATYPPIVMQLENGKKVEITGKIDRVDIAETEKGSYFRIIDYKSSVKKVDLNEVIYGLQIQLLTYMNELTQTKLGETAGILYFNLVDFLIHSKKNLTEEELEQELKKKYKMQGLVLADVKIVKQMDTKLEKGYSDTIPVYLDKDGNVSPKLSSSLSKEEFKRLQKKVTQTVKEISSQILQGDISLKPYYNKDKKTACEYCLYKSICNFNTRNKNNSYAYIPNLTKEEILAKLTNM